MKLLLIIIVITFAMLSWYAVQCESIIVRTPCNSNGFQCVNSTSFIICIDIGDNTFVPTPTVDNCPIDTVCKDGIPVPCVPVTTDTSTSTTSTISPSTTEPPPFICKQRGKFPGPSCSQYYKCTKLVLWYIKTLNTCPFGLWFNPYSKLCVLPQLSKCE